MTAAAAPPAIDPKAYERRWLILASLCLCLLLVVATVSSLNVAIPTLARELKPTDTQILWIIDAYAVVFAGLLLFAGALGDRFGRKGALLIGLVIFAAGAVVCSMVRQPNALIAFRGVMGVGAALIMPATLSLLTTVFPPQERPKAIAIWAAFAGAGGAIGPIMSGLLLTKFWYGSVFLIAVPLAAITFAAVGVMVPSSREGATSKLDPVGAVLSIVGFSSLLFAIIEGGEKGWGHGLVLGAFAVAAVALTGFVAWERRRTDPMLDMGLFRNSRFTAGSLGITFMFMAMFAMFFVLTQYLQYVRGYSPLRAALSGLPFAVTMIAVSPRAVLIAGKLGVYRTILTGMCCVAGGVALFSLAGKTTPYPLVAVTMVIMAAGMGMSMPALTSGLMSAVPMHKAGVGSAVNDTTRELGGAIGIAIVGSIVSASYRSGVRPALGQLPPEASEQILKSVGRASLVIDGARAQIGDGPADALLGTVRSSFLGGAHNGLRVGAAAVFVMMLVIARIHPRNVAPPTGSGH